MFNIEWPEDIGSARLVGRIGYLLADDDDQDRDPNIRAAVEGQVIVTPSVDEVRYRGIRGTMLLYTKPVKGVINNEGFLFTPDEDGNPAEAGLVVPASDTPVIQPYGYSYNVRIKVPNHNDKVFNIQGKPDEVVDLVVATPVDTEPGTVRIIDRETALRAEAAQEASETARTKTYNYLREVEILERRARESEENSKASETKSAASEKAAALSATNSNKDAGRSEKANEDARLAWSEIMDTVTRGGSFFIQDDPPPAGATYSWEGQGSSRYSTKRIDGAARAYNYVSSPRVVDSNYATIRGEVLDTSHYLENRLRATEGRDVYLRFISYNVTAQGFGSAGFTFDWEQGIDEVTLLLQMRDSSGVVSQEEWKVTKEDFPSGTRLIEALEIPQSASVFYAYVYCPNNQVGNSINVGRFSASLASTESEALEHVEKFFDGDTPDELTDMVWVNRDLETRYWIDGQWQLT